MPKKAIDYSNTSFYRIVCKDITIKDCYVGHTTNLIKRRNSHKNACYNPNKIEYDYKVYRFIRDNGGWNNWLLIEIDKKKCDNLEEAIKEEFNYYGIYNATLNSNVPSRTKQGWCNDNKEQILKNKKQYREENKQKLKDARKIYKTQNKEKIAEKSKEYRIQNKEIIKEHKAKPLNCGCGSICRTGEKARHFKSKKHLAFLEGLKPIPTETKII